jgi:hypothetical protein
MIHILYYIILYYIIYLTAVVLTPGCSCIVHIYTQTVHRTTQFDNINNAIKNRTTQLTTEQHNQQQNNTINNLNGKSASRVPSLRVIPWYLPYN